MLNPIEAYNRVDAAYNNATAGVTGGPEAAAGLLIAYKVTQSVVDHVASLLEECKDNSDTHQVIEGIRRWSRK